MFASSNHYPHRNENTEGNKNEWKKSCGDSTTMYRVSYVHVANCTPQFNGKRSISCKKLSAVK